MIYTESERIERPLDPAPRSDAAGSGGGLRSRLSLAGMPSIPQVLVRLLELFQSELTGYRDIAECIQQDVAMTARIFSIASSASQHGRQRPASLDQCLTVLGMGTIKTIVINESIFQVFRRLASEKDYDLGHFWGHSLRCALIARALAKASGQTDPAEAYLGGLLHDVGQLAMLTADPGSYLPLFLLNSDPSELCQREQAAFDITHAEVGAWLIEKWELDSLLADSVLYHHDRVERLAGAHPLIRFVHFADRLAFLQGDLLALAETDLSGYWVPDGLDLPLLIEQTEREMAEMAAQLGIATASGAVAGGSKTTSAGQDLALRVRDIVLTGNAFEETSALSGGNEALEHVIRALRIVFDIQAELCFVPQHDDGTRFVAHSVGGARIRQLGLEFVHGQNPAEISRAVEHGVRVLAPRSRAASTVLDDQIMRMVGNPGVIYLPLSDGPLCRGVLVAGVDARQQAELQHGRMLCLEKFIGMAGSLLASKEEKGQAPEAVSPDSQARDRFRLQRVVHEIGNPLAVIHNYLALLEHKFVERDIDRRELLIVTDEIERLSRILKDALNEPSGDAAKATDTVSLNALVEDLVELLQPGSGSTDVRVEIHTDLYPDLPAVTSRGDQLRQLVLNLLKNALEAIATEGGVIRVSTRPWANAKGPQFTEICIEDSGPGLPQDVLDRLYQPAVSNKGLLHQGIGLVIVGQLVRELDGLINCRSTEQGTCFQILLPHNR